MDQRAAQYYVLIHDSSEPQWAEKPVDDDDDDNDNGDDDKGDDDGMT